MRFYNYPLIEFVLVSWTDFAVRPLLVLICLLAWLHSDLSFLCLLPSLGPFCLSFSLNYGPVLHKLHSHASSHTGWFGLVFIQHPTASYILLPFRKLSFYWLMCSDSFMLVSDGLQQLPFLHLLPLTSLPSQRPSPHSIPDPTAPFSRFVSFGSIWWASLIWVTAGSVPASQSYGPLWRTLSAAESWVLTGGAHPCLPGIRPNSWTDPVE